MDKLRLYIKGAALILCVGDPNENPGGQILFIVPYNMRLQGYMTIGFGHGSDIPLVAEDLTKGQ